MFAMQKPLALEIQKKNNTEYISIETSLRFKKIYLYFFHIFKFNSSMELTTKTLNIFFSSRCHYCRNSALCLMAEKVFISWETLTLFVVVVVVVADERSNEIAINKISLNVEKKKWKKKRRNAISIILIFFPLFYIFRCFTFPSIASLVFFCVSLKVI